MSKFEQHETVMTDEPFLVAALTELGYKPQVHVQPVALEGYRGDTRQERAHIVIPRAQVGGASNDVGFIRENGVYRAIISDYDRRRFSEAWLGKLTQGYKEQQSLAIARQRGYAFLGKTVAPDGKVTLKFQDNRNG